MHVPMHIIYIHATYLNNHRLLALEAVLHECMHTCTYTYTLYMNDDRLLTLEAVLHVCVCTCT